VSWSSAAKVGASWSSSATGALAGKP
jgi:hypothetical protein